MGSLYSEQQTWLHAVPAGVKLLLLAMLSTALFFTESAEILLPSAAVSGLILVSLGRVASDARKLLLSILLAGLLVLAFHVLVRQPMLGVTSAARLLSTALLGVALTLSTRHADLLQVFEWLLSPLNHFGVRVHRLSLQMALMLRFTEHFFVQWKRLDEAHRVRTGKPGGWRLLAPLTIQMLVSARRVADTLEIRLDP